MNLVAVLLTGLFAGGVSCAAVQGGLLAGLITRQHAFREGAGRGRTVVASQQNSTTAEPAEDKPAWWGSRLGDDLAPVVGFLAGKLAAYTLLGALLGALGGVVQLSPGVRTWLQIGAGLLIITFGLAQLGVPGFRRIVVEPPASWTRLVRTRTRSHAALAPALLGVATVLLPCGVTLSVEALALASGSPWRGAAIMSVFVLGTSPMFAILGYAARKAATVWRGRLAAATGVAVVAMGLFTLNGGLELAGSPLAASRILETMSGTPAAADTTVVSVTGGKQEVVVMASSGGYSPRNAEIKAGIPTTLVVRSADATGCVRSFAIGGAETVLPESGDTRIDLGTPTAGTLRYACGMGMYTGIITIA
ncbi:sulfite exporter TauE/SafE family protein [Mycobacterium sp. AZCC_0083]|uniref:sulfite exporter TauE/SafE family protein n=1 Tax=Mycobacterium sp. AZCC_0083 TaxID=2735882 RepID=UPI001618DD62|nr:sulfite exporter TauE/SafE family protein [Mycobacterium sp. AZCC_0083]MBB5161743.1 sulfite exporter TauE/SafE [Mycobacterium sp. AZCC_0083]